MNNQFQATLLLILLLVSLICKCDSAKILCLFPTPGYSHQQPLVDLSYALAHRGHEMTILTTDPRKEQLKNVREVDISSLYKDFIEMQKHGPVSFQKRSDPAEIIPQFCGFSNLLLGFICGKQQVIDLVKELNGTKYDLILYESLFYAPLLGFVKITGDPPVVGVVTNNPSIFMDDAMGNPITQSYIPQVMLPYTDSMTLYQRFYNLYISLYIRYIMETCVIPKREEYLQQLFGKVPYTTKELEYNQSLLIVSTDWTTLYPKPHQPNTVFVGPLHVKKPNPLPQDLKEWMDGAEEGVIYFSLGSNMKGTSVPPHIREMFIKAFKQFPKYRVLWKWEADTDLPGRPSNVLARKWLPQQSILAHPKVRLFISQVGLQSLQEAISNKVPILGMPMFGDQIYNVRKMVKDGAARLLEFNHLSPEEIYENIQIILTDSSYKENIERLAKITNDKPMSAMDTAIWWVEYVIRHKGAPHLRPASLDLSWYQLHMIDILSIGISILLTILGLTFLIIRLLILYCYKVNTKLKIN